MIPGANFLYIGDTEMQKEDLLKRIRSNPLENQKDIQEARDDLGLLEFMLNPRVGWSVPERASIELKKCSVCANVPSSIYCIGERWFCLEHIPRGIAFPIGVHGEDYKRYKSYGEKPKAE